MAAPQFSLSDAEWLPHRHVESTDAFRFVHVPRADHAGIPFLTDDCLGPRPAPVDLPATACLGQVGKGPLHFVFHSAFCGSTLLTCALAQGGVAMGLSEPVVLNDIVGFRRRGAPSAAVARAADGALRLLGRPFAPGESVVVKPSNVVNPLAELFLALQPQARAVFLFAPLETFLISVARKGLPCRLWVRELLAGYLTDGVIAPLGLDAEAIFRQSDLQVAAVGWLAQHRLFALLAQKLGPQRLRSLDTEQLTATPDAALAGVANHFGLQFPEGALAAIATGPAFTRHSKSGASFTADDRRAQYAAARGAHDEEIATVLAWAEKVAEAAGVSMAAPLPLLDQP